MKRALLLLFLLAAACDEARETAPDELTIVVQGDRRELEQQERALHEREESLQKDKSQLDSRIAELARGLKAAADAEQRRGIEEELRRQKDLEGQITVRANALEAQRGEVEAKRQAIDSDVQKAAQAALLARQASVASRAPQFMETFTNSSRAWALPFASSQRQCSEEGSVASPNRRASKVARMVSIDRPR